MKIKVTVELEEGLKNTREIYMTAESVLLPFGHPNMDIKQRLKTEVSTAAMAAMQAIFNYIDNGGGMIYHFNQKVFIGDIEDEVLVSIPIKDVVRDVMKVQENKDRPTTLDEVRFFYSLPQSWYNGPQACVK